MNRLLTLLLCAFCLSACEKQPAEVDFADKGVELLNEGKEANYQGKPYTGLVRNKHSNGKPAGEYPYIIDMVCIYAFILDFLLSSEQPCLMRRNSQYGVR